MSLERRIQSKGDELPAKVFSPIGGPSRLTFLNSRLERTRTADPFDMKAMSL